MNDKKEMTARKSSVGADERQSLNVSVNSITVYHLKINTFIFERRWYEWLNLKLSVWMKYRANK